MALNTLAQYTLDGSEQKIELIGLYASIKNNSAATIYVSQSEGVDPNGENVIPIPAGESISVPANSDRCIYLLGSGKVANISGNEWQNFFKSAHGQGGGGSSTGGGITQQQFEDTLKLYATEASVKTALGKKVDTVDGMGLSSNDFTDKDKAKLDELENYDDTDVKADIEALKESKVDKSEAISTNGGTITTGDLKNNIPNGRVFHITQSTANPVSGIYFDGNEIMNVSEISDSGNAILATRYNYAHSFINYLCQEYPLNSSISAGNIVDGIASYQNFDNDRNFRCPLYSKQALTTAYKAYHALGGNDVATDLYEKVMDMPEGTPAHEEHSCSSCCKKEMGK